MKNSKRATVVSASAATLLVGGIAFAAWTTTGEGDGTITSGSDAALTVSGARSEGDLVPNTTRTLTLTVSNPNAYAVKLTSLAPKGALSSGNAGCGPTSSDVSFSDADDLTATVPAQGSQSYTVTVSMGVDSANECKNATFTQTYAATGASAAS